MVEFFFLQVYIPSMFWITVLDAFYQSLVCFFIPYYVSAYLLSFNNIAKLGIKLCFLANNRLQ